jgi:heptosyltransferase-2
MPDTDTPSVAPPLPNPRRILVISFAGIGDTFFATPLVHELRLNFPESTIDCFVRWSGSGDILRGNPHLNSVYQKDLMKVGPAGSLAFLWKALRNRYDISINTHPQSRVHYRVVARLINAPVRISHEYDHLSPLDSLLVNRTIPQNYSLHSVDNNLALLSVLGAKAKLSSHNYEIYLSAEELGQADQFISQHGFTGRKILGIHVGSGGTKNLALRRWPLDHYSELIRRFRANQPDWQVVLFGGPDEETDNERLAAQSDQGRVLYAKTRNFREAAALVQKCDVFLSVDTALMHVAAAMKVRKQIVLETPTWNRPIEPRGNSFTLVKNPAVGGRNLEYYRYDGRGIRGTPQELLRCMQSISVDSVYQALIEAAKGLALQPP